MRNTKGIAAIILAVIMACSVMTMIVPMAMGDDPTASTKASVNNAAPDVEIASIQPDPAYPPCSITVSGTLSDPNGLDDVLTMRYTIKKPDGSTYWFGPISPNDSWSFSCYLHPWVPHGVWTVEVTATDKEGLSDTDSMTFTVGEVTGIEIDFSTVNFGAINVSETRTVEGDYDNTTADAPTIRNTGNTNITAVLISATDMEKKGLFSDTIGNENIGAKVNETSWQNLDEQRTFTVTIPPANTAKIDYNLTVPTGTSPGSYSGTTSITANFEE